MTTVYNSEQKHGLHLSVSAVVTQSTAQMQTIHEVRCHLARRMANAIMENDKFFVTSSLASVDRLKIDADAIVMTTDELQHLMVEQFRLGVRHAQGYPLSIDLSPPPGRKMCTGAGMS